jgi:hypothetical protein
VVGDYTVTIFAVIFVKKRAIVTISKSSTDGKERQDVAHDSPAACSCSPSESIQCPCWYINNFVIYFRAHSLHGAASILASLPVVKRRPTFPKCRRLVPCPLPPARFPHWRSPL